MKKWGLMLAWLCASALSLAQAVDGASDASHGLDIERERSRIQAERARQEANIQTEEAACYARFVVTDCIRQVRAHRREVFQALRREEVTLNDAERQRKALAQIEQLKGKSSVQRQDEDAERRLEASQAQQEREKRAAEKAAAAMNAASAPVQSPVAPNSLTHGRTAVDIGKDKQQFTDKLKEAQEYRASRVKSNREKTGTPSKPLPVSP